VGVCDINDVGYQAAISIEYDLHNEQQSVNLRQNRPRKIYLQVQMNSLRKFIFITVSGAKVTKSITKSIQSQVESLSGAYLIKYIS
jgi:hypothetical protein